ncbi:hypothetical protein D3C80_1156390 [compost metagenome]
MPGRLAIWTKPGRTSSRSASTSPSSPGWASPAGRSSRSRRARRSMAWSRSGFQTVSSDCGSLRWTTTPVKLICKGSNLMPMAITWQMASATSAWAATPSRLPRQATASGRSCTHLTQRPTAPCSITIATVPGWPMASSHWPGAVCSCCAVQDTQPRG